MSIIKVRMIPSHSYKLDLSRDSKRRSQSTSQQHEFKDLATSIDDMVAVMAVNAELGRYDELDGHRMLALLEHKR